MNLKVEFLRRGYGPLLKQGEEVLRAARLISGSNDIVVIASVSGDGAKLYAFLRPEAATHLVALGALDTTRRLEKALPPDWYLLIIIDPKYEGVMSMQLPIDGKEGGVLN